MIGRLDFILMYIELFSCFQNEITIELSQLDEASKKKKKEKKI